MSHSNFEDQSEGCYSTGKGSNKQRNGLEVQKHVLEAMMKPETYDEDPGQIELIQTHIT